MLPLLPAWACRLLLSGLVLLAGLPLVAEDVRDAGLGWGCNIPETWVLFDADPQGGRHTFADSRGHALFQVVVVADAADRDARQLLTGVAGNLQAVLPSDAAVQAGGAGAQAGAAGPAGGSPGAAAGAGTGGYQETVFAVNGRPACLADLEWSMGRFGLRGYVAALDGPAFDVVLLASALKEEWGGYHDFLLSVMDSFYLDAEAMLLPGLLNQFVANDGWAGGHIADPTVAADASQAMIEREARVLQQYTGADEATQKKAWRRFYQLVWRDSFYRMEELALGFKQVFAANKTEKKDIPLKLLHYIQAFKYEEPQTLSDLRSPYDAANKRLGDCDARSLAYMILLEHLGFASVLMISPVHHHSLVGVDLPGEGIRFTFDGKAWLMAETTATVPLGTLNQNIADQKDWFGMNMHANP